MSLVELITVLLAATGVTFTLLSSVGVIRLPDLYTRVHAAGKAGTLGIIGLLLAVAASFLDAVIAGKMVLLIIFFLLTSPVAAHMLNRAAYLTGVKPVAGTSPNDLAGAYDPETRRLRSHRAKAGD